MGRTDGLADPDLWEQHIDALYDGADLHLKRLKEDPLFAARVRARERRTLRRLVDNMHRPPEEAA